MVDSYWEMMTQKKFDLCYFNAYYSSSVKKDHIFALVQAILSTGALTCFLLDVFGEQSRTVVAWIFAVSQLLSVIQPYLPFSKRVSELDKALSAYEQVYEDIEKEWRAIDRGKRDDDYIDGIMNDFIHRWNEIEARTLSGDILPYNKKINKQAEKEKNAYFKNK